MKHLVEISDEAYARLKKGKRAVGTLKIDEGTNVLTFKAFGRSKRSHDQLLVRTESGWMKESPNRFKFFSSVNKNLGLVRVNKAMSRDLDYAITEIQSLLV